MKTSLLSTNTMEKNTIFVVRVVRVYFQENRVNIQRKLNFQLNMVI